MALKISKLKISASIRAYTTARPTFLFLVILIPIAWIVLTSLFLLRVPQEPGILLLTFIGLIGISLIITYFAKGRKGVRDLFAQTFKWRSHIGYYIFALFAIPVLTILISLVLGSFAVPQKNWLTAFIQYVFSVISGFLIINLWEETGWTGFFQSKLMKNFGLLKGSLLTAPAFAAIHIPLYFNQPTFYQFTVSVSILFFLALFFRYLLGMVYEDTKKSVFIVGLLHASFNSSSFKYPQMVPASIIATIILTLSYHLIRSRGNREKAD